jgi:hypothetical protein
LIDQARGRRAVTPRPGTLPDARRSGRARSSPAWSEHSRAKKLDTTLSSWARTRAVQPGWRARPVTDGVLRFSHPRERRCCLQSSAPGPRCRAPDTDRSTGGVAFR